VTPTQPMRAFNVAPINGEPRVLDLEIAGRLIYENEYMIRQLIERNRSELERYGVLFTAKKTSGIEGGRPGIEYWLNEPQSVLVCMLSKTPRAADVRQELIEVFLAYRRGDIVPATPTMEHIGTLFEQNKQIAENVIYLRERIDEMVPRRQRFSKEIQDVYCLVVKTRYHRNCPCCFRMVIVDDNGWRVRDVLEYDHWFANHRTSVDEGWAVCAECNRRLENDAQYKEEKRPNFLVFHQHRRDMCGVYSPVKKLTYRQDKLL